MSDVNIASLVLSNWRGPTSGVEIRFGLDQPITTPEGDCYGAYPLVIKRAACTVTPVTINGLTQYTLTIPALNLPATGNAIVGNAARYTATFNKTSNGQLIQAWNGFESFTLSPAPSSTTWGVIRIANEGGILPYGDQQTFTRSEILSLLGQVGNFINSTSFRIGANTDSQSAVFDLLMGSDTEAPRLRWTGTVWQLSFDGTTFKTILVDSVQRVINPIDLGAYNDGTHPVETSAAILAAIVIAQLATGYQVHLSAGTYNVSNAGTVTVPGGVTMTGDGRRKSILFSTANQVIVDCVEGAGDYLFFGPTVRDIGIKGTKTAGSNQIGLRADDSLYIAHTDVSNVDVWNCGSHGVYLGKTFSSRFVDIFSDDHLGYPFLFNSPNMPVNHYESLYAGTLNAPYLAGYRVRAGDIVLRSCNGINSSPAGSWWAIVGDKVGVDGALSNVTAYLCLDHANLESSRLGGVWLLSSSILDCDGKVQFAGDASASGIYEAIRSEVNTADFPPFFTKGRISDQVVFANSPASFYANSMPIHANDLPRLIISGQGPLIAGGAAQVAYYNSTRARAEMLYRADDFQPIVSVNVPTTFNNPGPRYIEVTLTSNGIVNLWYPGYDQPGGQPVTIKNLSANGIVVTINALGGTVNGSSYTMSLNGDVATFLASSTALDFRLIGKNP